MKLDEGRLQDLVSKRSNYRVILLHGDDPVHVAEWARSLLHAMGDPTDPFPPAELSGTEHARAEDALNAPLLGAGSRLVCLRDATDAAATSIESILLRARAGTLLVEAGVLTPRSKLRSLVEKSNAGAAVQCRGDDRRLLAASLDRVLLQHGVAMTTEARDLLLRRSGGRHAIQHDAEKLALLVAGVADNISVSDLLQLDDDREAAIEALLFAAAARRRPEMDRLLETLLQGGTTPATLIRGLLTFMQRVRVACLAVKAGASPQLAVSEMRPPVFFRRVVEMRETIGMWTPADVSVGCAALWRADGACRLTGAPAGAICRHAFQALREPTGPRHSGPL